MIPQEHFVPYAIANAFGLAALALAFWRRDVGRWLGVAVFSWAAVTNAVIGLTNPAAYVDYAALTPSVVYRDFILGWFSRHVPLMVLPIAVGQLTIAALLASRRPWHRQLGLAGALTFLLGIAPLGVGSGFPFSVTFGAALLVALRTETFAVPGLQRALWWTPRLLGLLLACFLALFALDAFGPDTRPLDAALGFAIHLLPAGVVLAVVLVAWRWEWAGGVLFFLLAFGYGVVTGGRVSWMLVVSAPLVVVGVLFLWSAMLSRVADQGRPRRLA